MEYNALRFDLERKTSIGYGTNDCLTGKISVNSKNSKISQVSEISRISLNDTISSTNTNHNTPIYSQNNNNILKKQFDSFTTSNAELDNATPHRFFSAGGGGSSDSESDGYDPLGDAPVQFVDQRTNADLWTKNEDNESRQDETYENEQFHENDEFSHRPSYTEEETFYRSSQPSLYDLNPVSNLPKSESIITGPLHNVASNIVEKFAQQKSIPNNCSTYSFSSQKSKSNLKIYNEYIFGAELGSGSFGKVKEIVHVETLERFAVKIIRLKELRKKKGPGGDKNVQNEIKLMPTLKHKNVCCLKEVFRRNHKDKVYLVLELCNSTMHDMLASQFRKTVIKNDFESSQNIAQNNQNIYQKTGKFPEPQANHYFRQLMDGLVYLNSKRVVHKDIKPANLLISKNHCLKVSDFGVAEQLEIFAKDGECYIHDGTPIFQPPEIARGDEVFDGYKVDIYAAGVTLYVMLSGSYPYNLNGTVYQLYHDIAENNYRKADGLPEGCADIIDRMLQRNVEKRPTAHDVQYCNWLINRKFGFDMDEYFDPRRLEYHENSESSENIENGNSISDTQFRTVSRPISKSEDFLNDNGEFCGVNDDSFENENDDPNDWTLSLGRKGKFDDYKSKRNSHHNRSISADILGMRDEQFSDGYTPTFPPKRTPSKSSSSPRKSISNNGSTHSSSKTSITAIYQRFTKYASSKVKDTLQKRKSPIHSDNSKPSRPSSSSEAKAVPSIDSYIPPVQITPAKSSFPSSVVKLREIIDDCLSRQPADIPPSLIDHQEELISQAEYLSQNNGPSTNQATSVLPFLAEYYVESYLQDGRDEEEELNSENKSQNCESQNFESQNFETQNFESQNFESQNFESQNFEYQNFESQNFKLESQNISLLKNTKSQNALQNPNNASSPTAAKLDYPRESLISSSDRSQISSHTLIASSNKISDSGYPSFNDVQKANTATVKTKVDCAKNKNNIVGVQKKNYKSGVNTNFMKQLNEMDGFDANFTEFKIYGENQPRSENENLYDENQHENQHFNANQESGNQQFHESRSWKSPQFDAPPSSNNYNRKSSNSNQSDPYSDNMESPFGITVNSKQKPSSSPKNNNSDDMNCGIM